MATAKKGKAKKNNHDRTGEMCRTRKQIEEAFAGSLGNVTTICDRLKVSRQTFYDWKKKHGWINELLEAEVEKTFDWVENKMLSKIEDGDTTMMIFFAKTRMKQRGYIERQEIEHDLSKLPTLVDDVPNADLPPSGAEPPRA